jgi:hypothetical protein
MLYGRGRVRYLLLLLLFGVVKSKLFRKAAVLQAKYRSIVKSGNIGQEMLQVGIWRQGVERRARSRVDTVPCGDRLDVVSLRQTLSNDRREGGRELIPACSETRFEALQNLSEHRVQLRGWVLPFAHCVAEPNEGLDNSSVWLTSICDTARLTFSIPVGFVVIIMQKPRNAESFSSLSLISQSAVHQA